MNDAERAEEARQREFARLVAVELVTMIKEEIGSSVLKKILWLGVAVLFLVAMKFGVIRIGDAHAGDVKHLPAIVERKQ